MAVNLKGRSLLTLMDFTPVEIRYLLDLAHDLKAKKRAGIHNEVLKGKNVVLLFEKTSTRTRCAFEVACLDEGAGVTFLDSGSSQMGKKESLADTAKVLGRFYDGIEYRGFKQSVVEELAANAGVPVWNGLTDVDHPTQILADLLTIEEHVAKPLNKVKVVFCGDIRNNMSYAWMYGCAKMGMHYVAYGPKELADQLDQEKIAKVQAVAKETGAVIEICSTPECLKGADVLYTDIWASMGEEAQMIVIDNGTNIKNNEIKMWLAANEDELMETFKEVGNLHHTITNLMISKYRSICEFQQLFNRARKDESVKEYLAMKQSKAVKRNILSK